MTLRQQLDYIKNTCELGLPTLIATASLEPLVKFSTHDTETMETNEFGVYPDVDSDKTDSDSLSIIIKIQLYGQDKGIDYFDVIKPFLKTNILPKDLGYTNRDSLVADFYPIDQRSTSYVFFSMMFSNELDDCSD